MAKQPTSLLIQAVRESAKGGLKSILSPPTGTYSVYPYPDVSNKTIFNGSLEIYDLPNKVTILDKEVKRLNERLSKKSQQIVRLEEIKIKEFQKNDVYEVNKRIERLEAKIALLESNKKNLPRDIFGEYGWLTPIFWILLALLSGWIYG
jgi:uncharacterized small protein (DUF1192 family)